MRRFRSLSECLRASFSTASPSSSSEPALPLLHVAPGSAASSNSLGKSGGGSDTLGRRLLSLIHPKRSAVVVLRKWAEEGKYVQKYQLSRVLRELRKYKRYKHALQICEWMTTQPHIKLLPGDYAVHLDLVAKVRGLDSAEKFFKDLPDRMKVQSTYTAILHAYGQSNMSDKAESMLEQMSVLGLLTCPLPYNHILSLYLSTNQLAKVPNLMKEMKKSTSPDLITYNLLLTAFAKKDDVVGAENIVLQMKKNDVTPDWMTYSMLANIYTKAACHDKADEALTEMEKRVSRNERVAYSSLITLHASRSDLDGVYRVWNKMKSTFRKMSDVEYKCMLSSLTKLEDINGAERIYCEWELASGTRDSRVPNILLAFYVKNKMVDKAEMFHKHIIQTGVKPSYTTWELLVRNNLIKNQTHEALDCLQNALTLVEKWNPTVELVREFSCEIEKAGCVEVAERFLSTIRDAGYVTTEVYNSLLRTYSKAGKMPVLIAERMEKDNAEMDEETRRLVRSTSRFCISEVSSLIS